MAAPAHSDTPARAAQMHPEDLEIKAGRDQYCVGSTGIDMEKESSIGQALEAVVEQLTQNPTNIVLHEVFDPLFKIIRFFDNMTDETKVELVESTCTALSQLMPMISDALNETDHSAFAERSPLLRNAFKMAMFLLTWICRTAEKASVEKQGATAATAAKGAKGKKKKGGAHDSWSWEERQRDKVTFAIKESTDVDWGRLWKQSMVEEDFTLLYIRCGFVVLENPMIVRAEFRDLKSTAIDIICKPLHTYGKQLTSGVTTTMIHLVTKYEHAPAPASEVLATMADEFNDRALGYEVVQEVGKMDPQDLARDPTGCRNLSNLLIETAEMCPELLQPNMAVLMPHFDADNYPMRSALSVVIGELLVATMGKTPTKSSEDAEDEDEKEEEGAEEGEKKADDAQKVDMKADERDTLLELLADRVRDKNSLSRGKVLQTWCRLTAARAIPLSFLPRVTDIAVSRIKDKSSTVRKYAVQLVGTLLECNPFSGALKLSQLEAQYEGLKAELEQLEGEHSDAMSPVPEAAEDEEAETPEKDGEEAEAEESETEAEEEGEEKDGADAEAAEEGAEAQEEAAVPAAADDATDEKAAEAVAIMQKKVDYCQSAVLFVRAIHRAMETVMELLDSKAVSDVQEAISFIVLADAFKVEKSVAGVRKMMMLVWSKDASIKEHVITAYKQLFLQRPADGVPRQQKAMAIATSLVGLVIGATLGEVTSLEEIVTDMVKQDHIKDSTLSALWSMFGSSDRQMSQASLMLISMAGNAKPKLIDDNLSKLISVALAGKITTAGDMSLARHACIALQKLQPLGLQLPASHQLFDCLRSMLLVDDEAVAPAKKAAFDRSWFPVAEQVLNTVFMLCAEPEEFCTAIVRSLSATVNKKGGSAISKRGLNRVLFVVGHTAVKQFVYIETVSSKMKKDADAAEKKKADAKEKGPARTNSKGGPPGSPRGLEAELGIAAAIEEGQVEEIREMAESEILSSMNLIGRFSSVITTLCGTAYRDQKGSGDGCVAIHLPENVRSVAVLALCKLMATSSDFCEPNLRLLFTILKKDPSPQIRANIIIALGDLFFRFPNMLEPWSSHFFDRLSDHDLTVRKHTLMALTHLILNDMVKVRAQVSDIAMCLEDAEPRMQDLARMFFNELAHKGTNNPIYNYLPDIIGRLSHNASVAPDAFQRIIKFLISVSTHRNPPTTLT